jgi:hypothetical protein
MSADIQSNCIIKICRKTDEKEVKYDAHHIIILWDFACYLAYCITHSLLAIDIMFIDEITSRVRSVKNSIAFKVNLCYLFTFKRAVTVQYEQFW